MTDDPAPPSRGRFIRWVVRRPKTAFWSTLAVALLLGAIIGAAGADNSEELAAVQDELSAETARADGLQTERDDLEAEREDLEAERDDALAELERATARGRVPSFVGEDLADVRGSEIVDRYGWKVKTTHEPSDRRVGTILKQSVPEGNILARGMSIGVTVAKERPPEWTTIFEESGAGSKITDEFRIPAGKARISYSFTGGTNAILQLRQPGDDFGELLLNEIGDYSDTTRVYNQTGTRYLEIDGGQWSVQVQVFK